MISLNKFIIFILFRTSVQKLWSFFYTSFNIFIPVTNSIIIIDFEYQAAVSSLLMFQCVCEYVNKVKIYTIH